MNKFLWSITFLVYLLIIFNNFSNSTIVDAALYDSFSEVVLEEGKLLNNYTDLDYDKYYPSIEKRKFWGWNTYVVNKDVKAEFIEKTVLEVTNDKDSPIEYKYQVVTSSDNRTILDCSGTIDYEVKGEVKKFKHDLHTKVNVGYKEEHTNIKKRTEELKINCDANTKLLITIKGNGVVTNGVAAYYACWVRTQKGGFEYFTITHEFQSIEKVKHEKN